jgi:Cu/Zn superoxide dismutase
MMISKTNDFGESLAVVMSGLDAADFTDGRGRALGFHDEADQLHDASASLGDAGGTHAFERGIEPPG